MADRIGQQLGNYRLIRLLGEGGFAQVYLGEHIHLGTQAAIKILYTQLTKDDLDQFRTEARTIAHLIHPHIVRVLDFGVEGKTPFLVMDYAPHGTLRQRHPKGVRLSLVTIISYVKQVTDALQYAHDEKLIHRDIKPENMLLGRRNDILLSDFGIALVAQSSRYQSAQEMAGTMAYMAPEQIQGKPRPASDQYSLGIVVYEWITGDRPFHGSLTEIVGQHLSVPPPSLREKDPTISHLIEQVVLTALEKDPHKRFTNVQAFAKALEQASQSEQLPLAIATLEVRTPLPMTSSVDSPESISVDQPSIAVPSVHIQAEQMLDVVPLLGVPIPQNVESFQVKSDPTSLSADAAKQPGALHGAGSDADRRTIKFLSPHPTEGFTGELPLESVVVPATQPNPPTTHPENRQRTSSKTATVDVAGRGTTPPVARTGTTGKEGDIGGSHGPTRRHLLALVFILLTLLLIGGIALASLGGTPSATAMISVASADVSEIDTIDAVPGGTTGKSQVAARLLSSTNSQSGSVNATGTGQTQTAVQATGLLTFYNALNFSQTIAAGTVLTGADGVQVTNNVAAVIPAANPPTEAFVTVEAHAVKAGASGNIAALDIDGTCCTSGVTVQNLNAFSGGKDQQIFTTVSQNDIDGFANPLKTSLPATAKTDISNQKKANEQFVGPVSCSPASVTSSPKVGQAATKVTVSVTVTCSGEVYDQQAAFSLATTSLMEVTAKSPGAGFALVGDILTMVKQANVVDSKGTVALLIFTEGRWVYQFTDAQKKTILPDLIKGKSKSDAQKILLQQPGVSKVTIDISGGGNTLPTNPTQINIVVLPIQGFQETPTPTMGSSIPTSPGSTATAGTLATPTPTPTPVNGNGLGGS